MVFFVSLLFVSFRRNRGVPRFLFFEIGNGIRWVRSGLANGRLESRAAAATHMSLPRQKYFLRSHIYKTAVRRQGSRSYACSIGSIEFPPFSHLDRTTSYETEEAAKSYKFDAVRVAAAALRVERLDLGFQRRPRSGGVDPAKEAVTPRQLLLRGVLQVGKARLHRPRPRRGMDRGIVSRELACRAGRGIKQCFLWSGVPVHASRRVHLRFRVEAQDSQAPKDLD